MKKIDWWLVKGFIPPFVVTFSIALFVLVMQSLWLYIDDLAGKGLSIFLIIELLAYRCVGLFPLAIPLGILISSVMLLGNMGERYELSSLKSAGVSLFRIMRPLLVLSIAAGLFSIYCSNTLEPMANLKFGSRMYDIQQKKATLQLEPGIFNEDFNNYAIYIGDKEKDGRTVKDILIYQQKPQNWEDFILVSAKEGQMYIEPNGRYFVMDLRNGHQYVEEKSDQYSTKSQGKYPFVRLQFKRYVKVFDLKEFSLSWTNEDLFKGNKNMMSIGDLKKAVKEESFKVVEREVNLANSMGRTYSLLPTDSTLLKIEAAKRAKEGKKDSLDIPTDDGSDPQNELQSTITGGENAELAAAQAASNLNGLIPQELKEPIASYTHFDKTFALYQRQSLLPNAKVEAESILSQAETAVSALYDIRETRAKYIHQHHTKYVLALACIVFLFIGAPMGNIIRKGGFGYPILVSIIFFMIFVVLVIFSRKIAETLTISAVLAAWIPVLVLFPISCIITVKAMNDAKLFSGITLPRFTWLKRKKA